MRSNLKIQGIFFIVCLVASASVAAQKQNNVWLFGIKGGLDFNTNPPTAITNNPVATNFPYTMSSISDTAGKLLFYTDGIEIWNRNNLKLARKYNSWPWGEYVVPLSLTPLTTPLLMPYVGNDSLYYLFGVTNGGPWPKTLQYVTLNSKGDGERGEIVYPEPSTRTNYFTALVNNVQPLVAGTSHCNRKDQWVTTYKDNAFYSFLVSSTGVSTTPVVSLLPAGTPQPDTTMRYNIKFSANSEKLIFPVIRKNKIVVLDFNNLSGTFSNPMVFEMALGETLEDVELSPDGSKLYYGSFVIEDESGIELHNISQLDLKAGTIDQVKQSKELITAFPDRAGCTPHTCFYVYRTLQLAPDGKIYASMRSNVKSASVIEEPNEKGSQSRYLFSGFNLQKEYLHMSINYVRSLSYSPKQNGIQAKKAICADLPVDFSLLYERADSVKWNFGDPASGADNHSTLMAPQHRFTNIGDYTVTAIIYHKCFTDTASYPLHIRSDKAVKIPAYIRDTTICRGDVFTLDATTPFAKNYTWFIDNYLTYVPQAEVKTEGLYDVTVKNECSIDRKVFSVKYQQCDCRVFVPTAFSPNNDGLNDVFKPATQCYVRAYRFSVFNRFGQAVFSTTDPQKGWDGFAGPYPQATGTFIWTLQYQDPNTKKTIYQKGTVVLIR